MQTQLANVRQTWGNLPRRAQLAIAGVALVTIVVMFLVLRAATATTWASVATGMTPEKVGEAQTAIEEAGYKVRVTDAGGIEVPKADVSKASAALMTVGIAPNGSGSKTECAKQFGEGGSFMASTTAELAVKLETCQEGQTANAIQDIEGITNASVDVTLPKKTLFSEDQSSAKASVRLKTDDVALSRKSVSSIQKMVASSFDGLKPADVSVLDQGTGEEISSSASDSEESADTKKLKTEAEFNADAERKLTETFERIVGPGNVVVSSNVELDMDAIKREVQDIKPAGEDGKQLVDVETFKREILNGTDEAATQGVAGVGSNTIDPDNRTVEPDATGTGDGGSDYLKNDGNLTYANNKVAELIGVAKGTVIRNRFAVVVDDNVDAATAQAVKNAAQAWMGGNAQDSFSFDKAPIAQAQPVVEKGASSASAIAGYIKWALLGMGLIGLAFVLRRALTQRTAELLAPADDLLMLEAGDFTPIPIAELEAALAANQPDADRKSRLDMQKKVEQIAETKPHDVANELRRWMHQDVAANPYSPTPASRRKAS